MAPKLLFLCALLALLSIVASEKENVEIMDDEGEEFLATPGGYASDNTDLSVKPEETEYALHKQKYDLDMAEHRIKGRIDHLSSEMRKFDGKFGTGYPEHFDVETPFPKKLNWWELRKEYDDRTDLDPSPTPFVRKEKVNVIYMKDPLIDKIKREATKALENKESFNNCHHTLSHLAAFARRSAQSSAWERDFTDWSRKCHRHYFLPATGYSNFKEKLKSCKRVKSLLSNAKLMEKMDATTLKKRYENHCKDNATIDTTARIEAERYEREALKSEEKKALPAHQAILVEALEEQLYIFIRDGMGAVYKALKKAQLVAGKIISIVSKMWEQGRKLYRIGKQWVDKKRLWAQTGLHLVARGKKLYFQGKEMLEKASKYIKERVQYAIRAVLKESDLIKKDSYRKLFKKYLMDMEMKRKNLCKYLRDWKPASPLKKEGDHWLHKEIMPEIEGITRRLKEALRQGRQYYEKATKENLVDAKLKQMGFTDVDDAN